MTKAKKNRIDYLPAMGQAIMKGMAAEAVASIKKGESPGRFCTEKLYDLANIPYDFEKRWNTERAIEDIMRKAREFGFVSKNCQGSWYYCGPEVKATHDAMKAEVDAKKKKIEAFVKKLGLKLADKRNSIDKHGWGRQKGKTTVTVVLPKELWL